MQIAGRTKVAIIFNVKPNLGFLKMGPFHNKPSKGLIQMKMSKRYLLRSAAIIVV